MKNFAQYKPASFANQVRLICVVCFSLIGCSKYDQQAETIDVAYHLHGLWARNDAQVWVVGDAGEILHSTDGGEHWQPQKSGTRHQLSSVYAGASQLWIVGDDGTILHSVDGGERWQLQTSGTTETLTAICGEGAQLWTVGTDGTILFTTDGGSNWQQLRPTPRHLLAVFSVASQLWTVGYDGVILHSADRGRTWQPQRT